MEECLWRHMEGLVGLYYSSYSFLCFCKFIRPLFVFKKELDK